MCLQINDIRKDARVAEKPITVYKVLYKDEYDETSDDFHTPFQLIPCKIGDTIKAEANVTSKSLKKQINAEAVHAYINLLAVKCCPYGMEGINLYVTEWEIPAGATYWRGVRESVVEIAATEMKFVKAIGKVSEIVMDDFMIYPYYPNCKLIRDFATHYFTDEGEIKSIKEGQKVDKYHLCWSLNDIKSHIPQTVTFEGEKYVFYEDDYYIKFITEKSKKVLCKSIPLKDGRNIYEYAWLLIDMLTITGQKE